MDYYDEIEEYSGKLFTVLGLPVTAFAVCVVIGAVLGLVMALRRAKRLGLDRDAVLWFAMLGIPLGLFFARLIYCLLRIREVKYNGFWYIFRLDYGGFTVMGAAIGLALAAWITRRITKEKIIDLLDAVLPGLLMVLALERFAEGATRNGTGLEVTVRGLQFFPLARPGVYADMYTYAVHMFEGFTALVASVYTQGMDAPRGRAAGTGLILTAAAQVIWESLRRDDRLMFMMASWLMIFSAALLFLVLILCLLRLDWPLGGKLIAAGGFILLAAATGAMQFFMEGKMVHTIPTGVCFALSCLTTAGLTWLSLRVLWAATEE